MPRTIAEAQTPGRRRRSEGKKTAILDAAEALFLTEGYDRTSVDAVAARAGVSKRTVYDHFGDKETVFLRVVERVGESLLATVRAAVDEELTSGRDLGTALTAFAHRIVDRTFPSPDYLTFRRLQAQQSPAGKQPVTVRDRPEQLLEERFAGLAAEGAIHAENPAVAARHFTALTITLALQAALDQREDLPPRDSARIIADGVAAFLRAYA
ncbi:TetR/AcrR family transcriptional regulator [Symbioplanes lichenis]|uniref:TetR/AcrR family transcriptional regulator n=1 Tax=Symbioplanes lichenis TaxID=1629072 RepID=UPI002738CBDE|nr:TetR/AcrR family transcriptional regulator [Actinoplanes lichenis]